MVDEKRAGTLTVSGQDSPGNASPVELNGDGSLGGSIGSAGSLMALNDEARDQKANSGGHNATEMEALIRREQMEAEQRQREANEETTKSEDLRRFLEEMHQKRAQELLQQQQVSTGGESLPMQNMSGDPNQEVDIYAMAADLVSVEPPDGGWGWLVVIGSFFCMIVVDGVCFSYGIFLRDMQEDFGSQNKALVTLPGSLLTGSYLLFGPLASALANQFDFRPVAMVGAMIAAVAFLASSFVYNLVCFTLVYGVLGGIGFGLVYLPAIATVGHWFQNRRPLAVGLALCGSGIGCFIFGQASPYLIDELTWRGALLVLSAFSVQCIGTAVFYRPLELHMRMEQIAEIRRLLREVRHEAEEAQRQERQRQMEQERVRKKAEKDKEKARQRKKTKPRKIVIQRGSIMQRIIEEKRRQRTTSMGSLDGMVITRDNQLIDAGSTSSDYYDRPILSTNAINRIADTVLRKLDGRRSKANGGTGLTGSSGGQPGNALISSSHSRPSVAQLKASMPQIVQDYLQSQASLQTQQQQTALPGGLAAPGRELTISTTPNNQAMSSANSESGSHITSQASLDSHGLGPSSQLDDATRAEIHAQIRKEILRPQNKKDIFFSGSMNHLEQMNVELHHHALHGMNRHVLKMRSCSYLTTELKRQRSHSSLTMGGAAGMPTSVSPQGVVDEAGGTVGPIRSFMQEMLDVTILRSPTYLLMGLSSVAGMLGFFVPFHFLPGYATQLGFSLTEAGALISYIGIANTLGRMVATLYIERGWATRYHWADSLWINNFSLLLAGLTAILVPFFGASYPGLIVVTCIYGLCIAAFVSLRSILVVEFFGLERLTNAFSYLLIFQGMAVIFGQPIAGAIYDATQTQSHVFYFAGTAIIVSGLLCLPLRVVAAWERKRWSKRMGTYPYHLADSGMPDDSDLEGGLSPMHELVSESDDGQISAAIPEVEENEEEEEEKKVIHENDGVAT